MVSIEEIHKGNIKVEPITTHMFFIEEVCKAFNMIRERKIWRL